jgi:hypothetical protein
VFSDPTSVTRTGVAAHIGIFNQVLHALWRGGMFEASLSGSDIDPDLPAEASASVVTRLPPVAQVIGSQVEIHLGGIEAVVEHPDLPDNLQVSLGATVRTTVNLNGNDLAFSGLTIEELYISSDALALGSADQQQLEDMLRPLLQQLANSALNDALPSIPLPTFTIHARRPSRRNGASSVWSSPITRMRHPGPHSVRAFRITSPFPQAMSGRMSHTHFPFATRQPRGEGPAAGGAPTGVDPAYLGGASIMRISSGSFSFTRSCPICDP